jgi:hypothetical protein
MGGCTGGRELARGRFEYAMGVESARRDGAYPFGDRP